MNGKCDKCGQVTDLIYNFGSEGFRLKICGLCGGKIMKMILG